MVSINWISEIIAAIPNIFLYLIHGYVFIIIYRFIAFKSPSQKLDNTIFKSVVVSYLLKIIFDYFRGEWLSDNIILYTIILLLYSAILAYIVGIVSKSRKFSRLLLCIGIDRTPNDNIWTDIIRDNMWVRVYLKSRNVSYLGQYKYGEDFEREPIIVLSTYQLLDEYSQPIADYTNDPKSFIVLNTKDFEHIEIIES